MDEAIVFDLDGTLWDTTEVVATAWNSALGLAGVSHRTMTAGDIASIMGLTHGEIFPRLFPELTLPEQERLSHFCYAEEERFLRAQGGRLYAGVREGLTNLAERWPLAIVSNCQSGYIELFLECTGLSFQDYECHGRTGQSKGQNLKSVLRRNGWRKALFVGDTRGDQEAAAEAGCPFVYAAYGFGQVETAGPRLDGFADLLTFVAAPAGG